MNTRYKPSIIQFKTGKGKLGGHEVKTPDDLHEAIQILGFCEAQYAHGEAMGKDFQFNVSDTANQVLYTKIISSEAETISLILLDNSPLFVYELKGERFIQSDFFAVRSKDNTITLSNILDKNDSFITIHFPTIDVSLIYSELVSAIKKFNVGD